MSEVKYEEPQVMRRVMDFFNRVQAEAHRHLPDAMLIVNAYALPVLMHPTRRPTITAARACDRRLSKVCFACVRSEIASLATAPHSALAPENATTSA